MRKQIEKHELDNIDNFIREKLYDLNAIGCRTHKIIIGIPNWLKELIVVYNREKFSRPFMDDQKQLWYFGSKVQPHYSDEVVVFFENYHYDPERFKPAIHKINFKNEENRKEN